MPPSRARRRGQAADEAPPAPASVRGAVEDFARALGRVCPELDPGTLVERRARAAAFVHEHGPQASPHLLRADDDRRRLGRPDRLHPWVVPTAGSAPRTPSSSCSAFRVTMQPGLAIGDSPRFLAELAKLALELLARGRVLPALAWREDRWVARWEPVTTDPGDAERLRLLAGRCRRCCARKSADPSIGTPPETIVDGALGAFTRRVRATLPVRGRCSARAASVARRPRGRGWIAALTAADPVVAADELELAALAEQLDAWRGAMEHYAAHRTFRTCFRLSAPEDPAGTGRRGAPWPCAPATVARRDPAAGEGRPERARPGAGRVELERRWPACARPADRGPAGAAAGRARPRPTRCGPSSSRPCIEVVADRASSSTPTPPSGSCATRSRRSSRPGFGVLSPAWWDKRLRLKLTGRAVQGVGGGSGLFGLDGLCAYEWRIAVGDATLSVSELRELAAMKLPLVMSRGQWIVLRLRGRRGRAEVLRGPQGARRGAGRRARTRRASRSRLAATSCPRPRSRAPAG